MKQTIDELKIKKDKLYISGWVKENDFKILIKINGKNHYVDEYYHREDIKILFDESNKNKYGYKQEIINDKKIKKIKVIIICNNEEKVIYQVTNNRLVKLIYKFKMFCNKIIRGIKFLWREYKFIVPLYMVKIYIKRFFKKPDKIELYDPKITSEYLIWLAKSHYTSNKIKQELTYISTDKNKFNTIISKDDLLKQLKKVNTEYVCLINGKISLVKVFEQQVYASLKDNDVLYFDNDFIKKDTNENPIFKPDWSVDTIMGANYVGNCIVIKKDILLKYKINTNNIYEIMLKLRFKNVKIGHVEKIMYHDYNKKQNNLSVLKKYIKDNKIEATIKKGFDTSVNTVIYKVKNNPLISIVIPTKDGADILKNCLESIYNLTTYKNFEIIIIDNGSTKQETFDLFDKYKKEKNNIKIKRIDCEFNYSYLNNEAVKIAKGEYILLLNNDIEIITSNWLELMLGYAMQKHIGAVGVKLLFPDDTIQHAGVVMGKGGLAGHVHYMKNKNYISEQYELKIPYNYSVCTAACLMVKKSKYNEVGGLEESLKVAFNDVDFNLKLLEKNYYNIFLPNVVLYHHESKSRGLDTTQEKQKRFEFEFYYILKKWKKVINKDRFYNTNFSRVEDYMLEVKHENKEN